MQKEFEKFAPATLFEGMTSIRALFAARTENPGNDRRITRLLYATENEGKLKKELGWLSHRAEEEGFPIVPLSSCELSSLATGNTHGGILAECTERTVPPLCDALSSLPERGFFALLEGIEDPYNFGYALRSLYAAGVSGIILPERNWMSAAGVVARASAGASELLPIYTADGIEAADIFHALGYRVVSADTRTDILLPDADLSLPLLLIVGGEKRGISRALLDRCDLAVKIPYARDFSASLSAASATTMLAYEIMRQNR